HVWFKRDDLLKRVNLLLAEHYGAALGVAPGAAPRTHEPNRTPAKNLGFFETPEAVCSRIIDEAQLYRVQTVLEPSAGMGALANAVKARHPEAVVSCVEIHPGRAAALKAQGFQVI